MPQHKSAKKRLRQTERKKAVNKSVKSNVASQLKSIDKLIKDKKVEESMAKLQQVMSVLHKSTKKKIMHLNKASRTISKLQKDISAISK
tara:strand:+ start:2208 stop:2474 length:267 start_codon:yes stop_codon:yes gene_type:complete